LGGHQGLKQTLAGNGIHNATCGNDLAKVERLVSGVFGCHVLHSFFLRYLHDGGEGAQGPGRQSPVSMPLHGSEANGAGRGLKTGCTGHDKPESGVGGTQGEGEGREDKEPDVKPFQTCSGLLTQVKSTPSSLKCAAPQSIFNISDVRRSAKLAVPWPLVSRTR